VLTWDLPDDATAMYVWMKNPGDSSFTKLPYPIYDDSWSIRTHQDFDLSPRPVIPRTTNTARRNALIQHYRIANSQLLNN
jgi:hypothetical protein